MNAVTMTQPHVLSAPTTSAAKTVDAVSGASRILLCLEGGAALAGATFAYASLHGSWSLFALLFLVPDISMFGYLAGRRVGAASYNAAHGYVGPALLAGLGAGLGVHALLCVACIWAAHIGFDRLPGYGLKYATSFGDTHLGRTGRA